MSDKSTKSIDSKLKWIANNYSLILIVGALILTVSIAGIIYSGELAINDEMNKQLEGKNALPKTSIGTLSVYHIEFGFVFLLIVGFAALMWGYAGIQEKTLCK